MNLKAQLTALKTQRSDLNLAERAELSCRLAKEFEKAGDYEAAAEALAEFWPDPSGPPKLDDLDEATKADVLLRVGSLAGWMGSTDQTADGQATAKDLITTAIEAFERIGQSEKAAEARADLAVCYWREGGFDEARIILERVTDELASDATEMRATALVRRAVVEKTAGNFSEALSLFMEARPLVEATDDHALKGTFHNGLATLLNCRGVSENRQDFIDQTLIEFAAASYHFEQAGNLHFLARVENNLGYLFFTIRRYEDAHKHLDRARYVFLELKDAGSAAGVDETRARTLLAEGHPVEAERIVRSAVRTLQKGAEQAMLAEALTTQGTALARLRKDARARASLEEAIEVAETAGDLEGAGRAKLSIMEELGDKLSLEELKPIYRSAVQLLKGSQDPSTTKRLISCAAKLFEVVERLELKPKQELQELTWEGFSLKQHVRADERSVIERALRDAGGSVTRAARLLGFRHHQSLISLINSRHKELLKTRSAVRKRRRHLFSKPKKSKTKDISAGPGASQISILHVEDNELVARTVSDILTNAGMQVDSCMDGSSAVKILKGDTPYDAIIVDNSLPGLTGLEIVRRARGLAHRSATPIMMLSADDVEREAWRAGVDEFLRKPEAIDQVSWTIKRLIKRKDKMK